MKVLQRPPTGRRRTAAAVLATAVLLGGAGAATAVPVADDGDDDGARTSAGYDRERRDDHGRDDAYDDSDDGRARAASTGTGLKQAAEAAVKSVAGTVTSAEFEEEHGRAVWKVDVLDAAGTEHDVTVNADGKVVARSTDQDDGDDAARVKLDRTGLGRAVDAALGRSAGTATSAELDDHGRAVAWQVDVTDARGTEHEVTVDARSGQVTATTVDRDDDRHED
ncbi:PepSY domain-containing protein [Streptomyces sp. NPDC057616]|uniref:PepSY domain-containing protein n=1 Tax=Streptomyces sp. NPDC057616 TaxID=3346183 RepID=UPI0036BD70F8